MRVRSPRRDAAVEVNRNINHDDEVYAHLFFDDFPEEVFEDLLSRDPEAEDTRSQVLQLRLPNGDLFLGFFPQGDSYTEIEEFFV